jgi:hypothetical protein
MAMPFGFSGRYTFIPGTLTFDVVIPFCTDSAGASATKSGGDDRQRVTEIGSAARDTLAKAMRKAKKRVIG